ncbi:MAG: 2,3-bisphosphoglycerate-independent phosphoglycerate mutase, partial [Desulfobacterales bacterium]|nr:2,3-bisphosphoglycerate-independent phosphoglycerate mutase [Desulfobacterales bacterium]
MTDRAPVMLMILDGWGISPLEKGNAVFRANTPFLDMLKAQYPHTHLLCSGESVGLPEGVMGNSEVGHLNIGAGRIVYQDLLRINVSIREGTFYQNDAFNRVISRVKERQSTLHLMGLVSDGGVHSHLDHLFALLDLIRTKGITRVYVHAIMDGRDTAPDSGIGYIRELQKYMSRNRFGTIATICGRFYAMDRDRRWDRVEKAYRLYTQGTGIRETDPVEAIAHAYTENETDEFIRPVVMTDHEGTPVRPVSDEDGLIFFNFRADRAREISRAFTEKQFSGFDRNCLPKLCDFVCMTRYDETLDLPVAFPPFRMKNTLAEVISNRGLKQLRIAETEKYAHVTYFFNGGEEQNFPGEQRCLIPSPREVETYDLKPEMSAESVKNEVISRLQTGEYDLIVVNFANMDMVGHTGILDAAVKACETMDNCVREIVPRLLALGGAAIITADHGNAEMMTDTDGHPHTAHTCNPVP